MNKLKSLSRGLFLLVLVSAGVLQGRAQIVPKWDVKNILSTSPEAAMLGRFGDIPISYYTGTADVSIPIYTIKEGGLEVPIVLRYHGSGIRVDDEATNVGLGWSLEPGGAIIQVVTGKPDGYDNLVNTSGYNFLKNTDPGFPAITSPFVPRYTERYPYYTYLYSNNCFINLPYSDDYLTLTYLTQGHGQPDVYQYNFPGGYSGKFYINQENQSIVLLDKKQDIVFTKLVGGWTAKTMDGNTYYFQAMESAGPNLDASMDQGYTFKLTKIALHNGKEINFSYQDAGYYSNQYSETFHSAAPLALPNDNSDIVVRNPSEVLHHVKMLTGITGDNTTITFNLGSRIDLSPLTSQASPQKINSVDIKNAATGAVLKSFVFTYDYFTGANEIRCYNNFTNSPVYTATDAERKRLKLLSVQEVGYTGSGQITKPAYTFQYDESSTMPMKSSYSRDFWGYYNGQGNDKLIPDLRFFAYSDDPIYQENIPTDALTSFTGANRSPDATKMGVGMLKRITYPTGGYTTFDYEAHVFGNHAYPDIQKLQNATTNGYAQDNNEINDTKSYSFSLGVAQSITFWLNVTGGANPATNFDDMEYSKITLKKTVGGVTTTLREWQLLVDSRDEFNNTRNKTWTGADATIYFPHEVGAVYTISVDMPDAIGEQGMGSNNASVTASFNYFNFPPDYKISYGGGMRVSAISNYTAEGAIAGKKIIKYINSDSSPSGILMSPLKMLYNEMQYAIKPNSDGWTYPVAEKKLVWKIASESAIPFSDAAQGSIVGYSRVEEQEVDPDGNPKGKKVYTYYNAESQVYTNVPDDPDPLNGMIKTEETYNNSSSTVPLEKVTSTYSELQQGVFCGYKCDVVYVGVANPPCVSTTTENGTGQPVDPSQYMHDINIRFYPIRNHWILPASKVTEKTENGVTMSATETYAYNSKGQMVRTDSYDSKQQKRSVLSLYPSDNPGDAMSSQLISNGLYNNLQQQKVLLNDNTTGGTGGTELAKTYIYHRLENSQVVQDHITRSYKGAAPFTEVTFDKYLNYKTVCQFTENAAPVSLLWSFNYSKPIALIKGVPYATVESVLGTSNITTFAANANPSDADITTFLAPLRSATALGNAQIISYTYKPVAGLSSMTDAKGMTTIYEYDGLLRLLRVRDADNRILKQYDYQYLVTPGNYTPNWQVTGNYRCVAGTGGYNTGRREQEQKDNNPNSAGYNTLRWVDVGVVLASCPINADWQITGNLRCQIGTGAYATGHQEQEQKDHNPYSSTYNTLRWADIGANLTACPVVANWQATGNLRCQTGMGDYWTGHREQEQKDLNLYTSTYNTTRWVDLGSNPSACPIVPNWTNTGNYRCAKDANNLNTGVQEYEQKDIDPYSSTFNTTRWLVFGNNFTACPFQGTFAKMTYDYNDGYSANIVVRFYSDAACTIPKSVSNITINYVHNWQNYSCGIINDDHETFVCNGNTVTLFYSALLHENIYSPSTGDYCTVDHNWYINSGTGYQAVY